MTDEFESRFAAFPAAETRELHQLIAAGKLILAIQSMRILLPDLSLSDAQQLVDARMKTLGVDCSPPAPTLGNLMARARELDAPLLALEALWDGDTVHNWFIILFAIVRDSEAERGMGERWLGQFVQRHGDPVARACDLGRALANELGVPFFFGNADPGDEGAPRWWDRLDG